MLLIAGKSYNQKGDTYDYDLLIKNGKVYDGSLSSVFGSDVAIKDGKIVKVAKSIKGNATRVLDVKEFYITPGFIDLHTHVDWGMYYPENRACLNYLMQGVTSVIVGQCGTSAWNIFEKAEDQMKRWSEGGIGVNTALLVGHGSVRQLVMGTENREPTAEELEKMKALVKEAMEQGASGLSTGLELIPGTYAKTDEVIELVKVVAPYGGIYHTHCRNERDKLVEAFAEAIEISEKTGVRTHLSHFKSKEKSNWGLVKEASRLVEEARAGGLEITADQYPFLFCNIYPYISLIPWKTWIGEEGTDRIRTEDIERIFDNLRDSELIELYTKVTTPYIPLSERHQQYMQELSRKRLVSLTVEAIINPGDFQDPQNPNERMLFFNRLKDPEEGQKIRREVKEYIEQVGGAEYVIIGVCIEKELEGKSLKQIAAVKGKPVEDIAIELELMGAKAVPIQMSEEDTEYIMKKDYVGTGSDGVAPFYGIGLTHIRSYSTFLYKIKKYALEKKVVSVEHVIRSQTSLPANIMNWNDRGWIKEGYKADITVLDLKNIETEASISNPHQYCKGVKYLVINGKLVIDNGEWNKTLAGEVIKLKK